MVQESCLLLLIFRSGKLCRFQLRPCQGCVAAPDRGSPSVRHVADPEFRTASKRVGRYHHDKIDPAQLPQPGTIESDPASAGPLSDVGHCQTPDLPQDGEKLIARALN